MATKLAMEIIEEKKLLIAAKRRFVYCAVASGYGDTRGFALLLLARTIKPKQLASELSEQFEEARNIRFGIVSTDRKTIKLELNKPALGLEKKIVRTLKGTGFTKADISYSSSAARGKSETDGKNVKDLTKDQDESDESDAFGKLLKKFGLDNDAALRSQIRFLKDLMQPRPGDPKKIKKENDRQDRTNIDKVRKTLEAVQQFGWEALKLKEAHANELTGPIRGVVRLPANFSNTISDDRLLAILGGLAEFLNAVQEVQE
jgi:hypothetical protein